MDDKFFYDYDFWIGQNSDLSKYWTAYKEGEGYKKNFSTMKCHLIEIAFDRHPKTFRFST